MTIEIIATICFALAVIHTFLVAPIREFSHRYTEGSLARSFFHLASEVEVVFGLWALLFYTVFCFIERPQHAVIYHESLNFTEAFFVFVIMSICSSNPILDFVRSVILFFSRGVQKVFKTPQIHTEIFMILSLGSLSGSFITEPASMSLCALLLFDMIHTRSSKTLYALLAVLFVNVSIGGALTSFAAPPILMVASNWGWDSSFVFQNFGWKALSAVLLNSFGFVFVFRNVLKTEFKTLKRIDIQDEVRSSLGVSLVHLIFLVLVVLNSHNQNTFLGLFLLFLGFVSATPKYQTVLRLRESLLVAFFLGGIIVFGQFQRWWLQPLLSQMGDISLYLGAVSLTAVTDNAALTYLGSLVPNLSDVSRYAIVAGAIAGGGLTVIANAPNPAGLSILQSKFEGSVVRAGKLFVAALIPTLVAVICLWVL